MKLFRRATNTFDLILSSLTVFAAVLILVAMLIVSLDVSLRYLVDRPQIWVVESTEFILVWVTFLSAAWILKKERHVRVEIVVDRLSPRTGAMLGIILSIMGAGLCVLLLVYSSEVVWNSIVKNVREDTMLRPPKGPLLMAIPLGSLLLVIQFLRRGYGHLRRWLALSRKGAPELEKLRLMEEEERPWSDG